MKYELFFLNNIHDSMEMVNVEIDPFLDLLHGWAQAWRVRCNQDLQGTR